jgi:hypothetical protein
MRFVRLSLVAGAAIVFAGSAIAESAHTTRIETQRYYGAIVTLEHGVRVTRPLPPTQHMIINPDGATPLSIGANGDISAASPPVPAEPEHNQENE